MEGLSRTIAKNSDELHDLAYKGYRASVEMDAADAVLNRGVKSHKLLTVEVLRKSSEGDVFHSKLHFLDICGVERPVKQIKVNLLLVQINDVNIINLSVGARLCRGHQSRLAVRKSPNARLETAGAKT